MARVFLVLFQYGSMDLDRSFVYDVEAMLPPLPAGGSNNDTVDVWLESAGGDADAAYKLCLTLRHYFQKVRVVIPDYAKSAATLFALGCDEIFMRDSAELGPLDAQIHHTGDVRVSALDVIGCVDQLAMRSVDLVLDGGARVIEITELPRAEVLTAMLDFVAQFMGPIVGKVDPAQFYKAHRQLAVAGDYAIRLLPRHLYGKDSYEELDPAERDTVSDVARKLLTEYASHSFVISCDEARRIGLAVQDLSKYDRADVVMQAYRRTMEDKKPLVAFCDEQTLVQMMGVGAEEQPGED